MRGSTASDSITVSILYLFTLRRMLIGLSRCEDQMALVNGLPRAINANHESSRVNNISSCFKNTRTSVLDRKSTRLNSSHSGESRMPSSA